MILQSIMQEADAMVQHWSDVPQSPGVVVAGLEDALHMLIEG